MQRPPTAAALSKESCAENLGLRASAGTGGLTVYKFWPRIGWRRAESKILSSNWAPSGGRDTPGSPLQTPTDQAAALIGSPDRLHLSPARCPNGWGILFVFLLFRCRLPRTMCRGGQDAPHSLVYVLLCHWTVALLTRRPPPQLMLLHAAHFRALWSTQSVPDSRSELGTRTEVEKYPAQMPRVRKMGCTY